MQTFTRTTLLCDRVNQRYRYNWSWIISLMVSKNWWSPSGLVRLLNSFLSSIKYESVQLRAAQKQNWADSELQKKQQWGWGEKTTHQRISANHTALCSWVDESFSVMVLCWSHPSGRASPGTHCVLLVRLPSAEVIASLEVSYSICEQEHSSLSYISLCFLPTL